MQWTDKQAVPLIATVSVVIPVVVAVLLYTPTVAVSGFDPYVLPFLNAIINSTVTLLLLAGLYFVKTGRLRAHKICMLASVGLSALFLVSYVVYHGMAQETKFGGEGPVRQLYFFLLISHIVLAAAIVPLVLFTVYRSLAGQFERHKKLARITFPLWLYVTVTGVVVYLMISPYYPQ
ncbi:MAG: DUF420 domain-containing protein [Bacteroidia bacterium]|nr:DUF420 domain-containing protein [Bacteroidia bacterium]